MHEDINMANCDDFELIDETDSIDDSVFELVDTNGDQERQAKPKISDLVLPLLIPTPFIEETSPIIEQQTFSPIVEQQTFTPIVNIPDISITCENYNFQHIVRSNQTDDNPSTISTENFCSCPISPKSSSSTTLWQCCFYPSSHRYAIRYQYDYR